MRKAKLKMQETTKEKLAESEGQLLLELLCEAVDKMGNASAKCTSLEQQLKNFYLEDPSLPKPEIAMRALLCNRKIEQTIFYIFLP